MLKKIIAFPMLGLSLAVSAENIDIRLPNGQVRSISRFYTYTADRYEVLNKNIELLNEIKKNVAPIKLASFTSTSPGNNFFLCRGSFPLYAPNKDSFESFVEGALKKELDQAGLLNDDAQHQITGRLDNLDFSSVKWLPTTPGKWTIQASFNAPGKEALVVKQDYEFSLSREADVGCSEVTNALVPAIQSFLNAVYSNPRFIELFND